MEWIQPAYDAGFDKQLNLRNGNFDVKKNHKLEEKMRGKMR